MAKKSILKKAILAENPVDFKKLHQKKMRKKAARKQQAKAGAAEPIAGNETEGSMGSPIDEEAALTDEDNANKEGHSNDEKHSDEDDEERSDDGWIDEEDEEDEEDLEGILDLEALDDSDTSGSDVEMEAKFERKAKPTLKITKAPLQQMKEDAEDDEEDEEDIPMSDLDDLSGEEREDLIPHSRLTINNTTALLASLHRIAIPTDKSVPFVTHQSVTSVEPTAAKIEDIQDDLKRELAFYAQSLDAAKRARALLKAEGAPFSRPKDYFAEMVKDDGHMQKVKAKLVEEASNKKAAQEARKLRDLKKFGKQVQVSKLQERQKAKKETLEKVKSLKRKRQESSADVGTHEAELFDVGVDKELEKHSAKRAFGRGKDGERTPGIKRQKKDAKYGFGGKKRHSKSGDAVSSGDLSGFSAKRMKTGAPGKIQKTARLGKSRRKAGGAKR